MYIEYLWNRFAMFFYKLVEHLKYDDLVKSPKIVMPDLIRHPEVVEFTGFRLSPE